MKLPYLICEVGLNHSGDYATAVRMIHAAADAGADAVKFQYVKADRLVSHTAPAYFQQVGEAAATQHAFFARSDRLDRGDYERLAVECQKAGVDFLCTVFDVESVEWVAPLVKAFKVASADITNIPLLEAIVQHGKPVYLSTGAATENEVFAALNLLVPAKPRLPHPVTVLHCVLSYPTRITDANLGRIGRRNPDWAFYPTVNLGYSDHTLFNLDVLTTAWLLGASVIEKHFTLDKTLPGNDHYHSMDATDLRALVAKLHELQAMIGDGEKRVLPCEFPARNAARQSWHATRDLPAGTVLTADDVILKRPGDGLPPSDVLVGRTLEEPVGADESILAGHFGVCV